ncbi:MAG: DUF4861 domain-containing protein [Breznakibacter sp.]
MRKITFALVAMALITACTCQKTVVSVSNASNSDLADKVVVMTRAEVEAKLGKGLANQVAVAYNDKGEALPSQCDDLDGDGQWDELAFLLDIKANESKKLTLQTFEADKAPQFTKRTNIRFGQKNEPYAEVTDDARLKSDDSPTISAIYQMEGPAWENDVVGFRNYYDARNGMDIYGKRTNKMALDSAGIRGQNYHVLSDWGMDILKVANSLGAGAIAISVGDSVYRVGPCEEGHYRFITEGPVRAIFELTYKGVPAGDRLYNVRHRIAISASNSFYCSKVWVDGLKGDETLTTGIVTQYNLPLIEAGNAGYKIFGTLGNQAFDHEYLGLGLFYPENQYVRHYTSPMTGPGVTETYLNDLKLVADTPAEYHFFSAWELQDANYKSQDYFVSKLQEAATKEAAKVDVK